MSGRLVTLITTICAAAVVIATMGPKPAPSLVWNASESVPVGLYRVQPAGKLTVTDLVVALPPEPLATFLAEGGYLPRGVPLIKRVLALPKQTVCRKGLVITVDGIEMGTAHERDRRGHPLPRWQGCRIVAKGDLFLMNWDEPASLDGRYFGPIAAASIVGRADPLWTFEEQSSCVHFAKIVLFLCSTRGRAVLTSQLGSPPPPRGGGQEARPRTAIRGQPAGRRTAARHPPRVRAFALRTGSLRPGARRHRPIVVGTAHHSRWSEPSWTWSRS